MKVWIVDATRWRTATTGPYGNAEAESFTERTVHSTHESAIDYARPLLDALIIEAEQVDR